MEGEIEMELGKKIQQLRKLSGMTQEQLAEKLNVSRQALSKWENETSTPDVESVVKISNLFQISLEELLKGEKKCVQDKSTQITLEDLSRINAHNRKMNILLTGGFVFLAIGIMMLFFVHVLEQTTSSLAYIMYRYMVVGQYVTAPVNYFSMRIPAIFAGIIGVGLCALYFLNNQKNERIKMKKNFCIVFIVAACAAVMIFIGIRNRIIYHKSSDTGNLYGNAIAELGDDDQYALVDIGEKNMVLFVTDQTYDDGQGHNAAISCSVYYGVNGNMYDLGEIASMGTAYPVSYGEKCIYTASGHGLVIYTIDSKTHQLTVRSRYLVTYDEEGNAYYSCETDGMEQAISEEDFLAAFEDYDQSNVVNFGYGLSDRS